MKQTRPIIFIICTMLPVLSSCELDNRLITMENIEKLHSWSPRTLYRDFYTWPELSPDASRIAYIKEGQLMVLNLPEKKETDVSSDLGFERVSGFRWYGNNMNLDIYGYKERKRLTKKVNLNETEEEITYRSEPFILSKDGRFMAFYNEQANEKGIWLVNEVSGDTILAMPDIYPRSMKFSHSGSLLAIISQEIGISNRLSVYDTDKDSLTIIRDSLDAIEPLFFTPDDQTIILSMISERPFIADSIHQPVADRDLDLYAINIETGKASKIFASESEDVIIGLANNKIYWTEIKSNLSIGIVPFAGGEIKILVDDNAFGPVWHPGGTKISATYGQFRLMDFPMNWDIGSIEVDSLMAVSGSLYSEVNGYHEDMFPMWSPDGNKIAYHSHRSPHPVASYREPGSTDGIWLTNAKSHQEYMVVNEGYETAMCDWSSDGRKMIFSTVITGENQHKPYIYEFPQEGTGVGKITPLLYEDLYGDVLAFAWSPDGNEIAIEEDLGSFRRAIRVVRLDNRKTRKIVEFTCLPRWGGVDFSPDGKYIVYSALSGQHHQIFKIRLNDMEKSQLTHSNTEVFHPQVSPCGKYIVCSTYEHSKEIWSAELKY